MQILIIANAISSTPTPYQIKEDDLFNGKWPPEKQFFNMLNQTTQLN